jgi:hypothetical protein
MYVYINTEMDVEVAMSCFTCLFQDLLGKTEENHKNFRQYSQFLSSTVNLSKLMIPNVTYNYMQQSNGIGTVTADDS